LVAAGCKGSTPPDDPPPAAVEVRVSVAGTAAASVVARVTAADIAQTLVFQLAVSNGQASARIEFPAGTRRTIVVHVADAKGIETHRGSVTLDVQPGSNPATAVTLAPVMVDSPITVSVGRFAVAVSPGTRMLTVGETSRLEASIVDGSGAVVPGAVSWASTNPSIASVDATGLVTARRAGAARVVAVHGPAAGAATITVADK
jgi:alpha-amylase